MYLFIERIINESGQVINNIPNTVVDVLVDNDDIPSRHFGVILEWKDWKSLQEKIKRLNYPFLVEPKIRFKSKPGEQGTFFISDPSGNALEFKTFKHDSMVFEKF